jgi:hypothetical protein
MQTKIMSTLHLPDQPTLHGARAEVIGWKSLPGLKANEAALPTVVIKLGDGVERSVSPEGVVIDKTLDMGELVLHAAGMAIKDSGSGNGWYALLPGESNFMHYEDRHNYIGFFSTRDELIEDVAEGLEQEACLFVERGTGKQWGDMQTSEQLSFIHAITHDKALQRSSELDALSNHIATYIKDEACRNTDGLCTSKINASTVLAAAIEQSEASGLANAAGEYLTALSIYVAGYIHVQLDLAVRGALAVSQITSSMVRCGVDEFNGSKFNLFVMEKSIEMANYEICQSDFKGYYFETDDYASEDFSTHAEAIEAAYKDLTYPQERESLRTGPTFTESASDAPTLH